MQTLVDPSLEALQQLSPAQLQARYVELFGEPCRTGNKAWLIKRLAWRLQCLAEGDLSQRARRRAAELACDADLRLMPPRQTSTREPASGPRSRDPRLPLPGSLLTRRYKGRNVQVRVLLHGFAYDGNVYPSLTAVAHAITGSHCNGYQFFQLSPTGGSDA
jgi:hypothetical protein